MPYVVDVVVIFQCGKKLLHFNDGVGIGDGSGGLGNIGNVGAFKTVAHFVKSIANAGEIVGSGVDFCYAVFVFKVLAAGFHNVFHKFVFVKILICNNDKAFAVEHKGNGTGLAKVAAVFGKIAANIAGGSVAVVGKGFYNNRYAAGTVTFVSDFFEGGFIAKAGSFFDGSFDVIVRNVVCFCFKNKSLEFAVVCGIWAAFANCNGDFFTDFGKNLAAGRIDALFFTFDGTPFGMSGQYISLLAGKISLQIILTHIKGFCKPF